MKGYSIALSLSGAFAGGLLSFGSAAAQTVNAPPPNPETAADQPQSVTEIVVTAQRRRERLQDVPIAVTALSAEALQSAGVTDSSLLLTVTPGLNFTAPTGGFAQYRIRGVGTSSNAVGVENPVATYIDGVYIGSMSGALQTLNDVEQVAVLKGPQGTLFGRNATGGLIQITTKTPEQDFHLDGNVGYGNLDTVTSGLYMAGGLAENLAANASVYYSDQGKGFGKDLTTNQDVNRARHLATREKLKWDPTSSTTITLAGDYSETNAAMGAFRLVDGAFGIGHFSNPPNSGPFDVSSGLQPALVVKDSGESLTVAQDFGPLRLQSITAGRRSLLRNDLDYDETPKPFQNVYIHQLDKQFSQELQLQPIDTDRLVWVLGLYYFNSTSEYNPVANTGIFELPAAQTNLYVNEGNKSYSGYGQATYHLTESTNLTGGLRYTSDDRRIDQSIVTVGGPPRPTLEAAGSHVFNKVTDRLSLDHRFTPDLMAYVSYDRGFQAGAYVAQAFPLQLLKPETLDAYEIGMKSDLFDRRLRLNVAVYDYNLTNIQVQTINHGLLQSYNGSGAKIRGIDADMTAQPADNLTLTAGVSAIHGKYSSFPNALSATPLITGGNLISTADATGNNLQQTPDWTVNLGFSYVIPTSVGNVELNGNYYHNAGWSAEVDNRLRQPAYNLYNASVLWRSSSRRYSVSAWGKNLSNTVYAAFLTEIDAGDTVQPAAGRTFGGTLLVHF